MMQLHQPQLPTNAISETHCVFGYDHLLDKMLTLFVGNKRTAASLPEMTRYCF